MSDSESAPSGHINSFGSIPAAALTVGSPPGSYHIGMQASRQQSDVNGTSDGLPSYLKSSSQLNGDLYTQSSQGTNNAPNSLYNSLTHPQLDFSNINSAEHDALNKQSINGFSSSGPFRQSFNLFPNSRPRNGTNSFRDPSTNFGAAYQAVPENIFVPNASSSGMPFEPVHHPGRYDMGFGPSGSLGQSKATQFTPGDAYRLGLESSVAPAAPQIKSSTSMPGLRDAQTSQLGSAQPGFTAPHMNGISHSHQHHNQVQVQNAFGALPNTNAPVPSAPGVIQQSTSGGSASGAGHGNGVSVSQQAGQAQQNGQQPQEEISTIFVVGFPDDMSEREFQNMFTFSTGFEAATLKIPNKDLTAYSGASGVVAPALGTRATSLGGHYGGSSDPYNIVNINQGGVVVDGRDGTTSWPAAVSVTEDMHFSATSLSMQPPRKQIIGFAKFRTRKEALEARDVLQGRRVDVEKGAVLKAEMAKKNLHTKRGPGVGPLGLAAALGSGTADLSSVASLSGLSGLGATQNGTSEVFSQRDRELGALGAMGLGRRLGAEEEVRQNAVINLSQFGPRGARERAEEDERERERKRKEKESQRLRQNSFAFEAFHSVPQQMVRQGANSLLSAENGVIGSAPSFGMGPQPIAPQPEQAMNGINSAPWGVIRDVNAKNSTAPIPISLVNSQRPLTPGAEIVTSPTTRDSVVTPPNASADTSAITSPKAPHDRPTSPSSESASLTIGSGTNHSLPTSSASSVNGSVPVGEEELTKAIGALSVSTAQGCTSPQLPSPSSGSGRPGDQNPPINTLYVGNLPTLTSTGSSPPAILEEHLRDLFKSQPGYSKLVFRQKSNGLMCFVEFEDVSYATKAINDLYGQTLGGLIKNGGIRLSYSKNPLGVRTPTNGTNGGLQQQTNNIQQQGFSSMQAFSGEGDNTRVNTNTYNHTRRDTTSTSGMTSPTSSYFYTMSSPPPRFLNSPPGGVPYSTTVGSQPTGFPRTHAPFGMAPSLSSGATQTTTFSPFGLSPSSSQSHQSYNQATHHPQLPSQVPNIQSQTHSMIPDQPSADTSKLLHHDLSHLNHPHPANIEAGRAG